MNVTNHEVRAEKARQAFEALGPSPSQSLVLQIQCNSAHHVAGIHDTTAGLVYYTVLHSKSHGRRDYVDLGHHASRLGLDWFDLLDPGDDPSINDDLPAGCECGPATLSRQLLIEQVSQGLKRVNID